MTAGSPTTSDLSLHCSTPGRSAIAVHRSRSFISTEVRGRIDNLLSCGRYACVSRLWLQLFAGFALLSATLIVVCLWATGGMKAVHASRFLGSFAGILPGVIRIPAGVNAAPFQRWQRYTLGVVVLAVTVFLIVEPVLQPDGFGGSLVPLWSTWINFISCIAIFPIAMACVVAHHPPSRYMRDAVWTVVGIWLITMLWTVANLCMRHFPPDLQSPCYSVRRRASLGVGFFTSAALHLEGVTFVWTANLVERRLRALEERENILGRHARLLIFLMGAAFHCKLWAQSLKSVIPHPRVTSGFLTAVFLTIWMIYTGLLTLGLARSIALLRQLPLKLAILK